MALSVYVLQGQIYLVRNIIPSMKTDYSILLLFGMGNICFQTKIY